MLMDRFDEVTVGVDPLYFIPSARPEHSGTYQCEIFSQEHSLVRIYYYLTGAHSHIKNNDIPGLLLLLTSLYIPNVCGFHLSSPYGTDRPCRTAGCL